MVFNCHERRGAVDEQLVFFAPRSAPAPVFDSPLFTECNFTCNGQTLPGAHHRSMVWIYMWRVVITTRSSFPTTLKVSYFLNPLILVRTRPPAQSGDHHKRGIWTGNIIRFALSQRGMFFFFYVYSQSVPHLQQALGINSEWRGGMVMVFRCRHALREILPITEIFIA